MHFVPVVRLVLPAVPAVTDERFLPVVEGGGKVDLGQYSIRQREENNAERLLHIFLVK